ncbi:hypothetical protein C0992_009180, partial [Termitomyces sp. T32_za158]
AGTPTAGAPITPPKCRFAFPPARAESQSRFTSPPPRRSRRHPWSFTTVGCSCRLQSL